MADVTSTTTPTTPKPIKIDVTSGVKGQPLTVRNRTTGEEFHITLQETAKAMVDLHNLTSGFTDGDIIDVMVAGEKVGHTSFTATGDDPQSVTLSTSSSTSGLARGI